MFEVPKFHILIHLSQGPGIILNTSGEIATDHHVYLMYSSPNIPDFASFFSSDPDYLQAITSQCISLMCLVDSV